MNLTPQQQAFIHCLEKVDPNTLWGLSIQKMLQDVNGDKLDALVDQLKSQERDNPVIMKEILDAPCYEALLNYQR